MNLTPGTLLFVSKLRTDPTTRYVSKWIKERQAEGENMKALATKHKISPSNMNQVADLTLGVGTKTGPRFAKMMGLKTHAALIDAADSWARLGSEKQKQPLPKKLVVVSDERYPNRALAIEIARQLDLAEFAIAQVEALQATEDPPPRWWLEQIQAHDKILGDPFRPKGPSGRKETEDL